MKKIKSVKALKKGQEIWFKLKDDRQRLKILEIDNYPNDYSEISCEHLYYESIGKRSSYAETILTSKDIANGLIFST